MTKVRPPLSIDGALGRIAGQLPGAWAEMAAITGRSESQVRRWGDHDQPDQIPLPLAIELDLAHAAAGGEGHPIFETYGLKIGVAIAEARGDGPELAAALCLLIREAAEAQEALVLASLPAADAAARDEAVRQLEDVVRVVTSTIARLRPARAPP